MSEQFYAESVPYFARNEDEVAQLQREAAELRETVESKKAAWVYRERAAARLKTVERELQMARAPARRQEEQVRQQQGALLCRSDCGTAFLVADNTTRQAKPQFMEPVPYFAT